MTTQTRAQQLKEIEFQTQMLNNLKKWIRNLIILSSIGIILAYWGLGAQSKMPFTVFAVTGAIEVTLTTLAIIIATNLGLTFLIFFPFLCRKKDDLTIIVLFQSKNNSSMLRLSLIVISCLCLLFLA